MELHVTHSTMGREAFLLQDGDGKTFLFDRVARRVSAVDKVARLARNGSWESFDGDPVPIIEEVRAALETNPSA